MASATMEPEDITYIDEVAEDDPNTGRDEVGHTGVTNSTLDNGNIKGDARATGTKGNIEEKKPFASMGNQGNRDYMNLLEKLKEDGKDSKMGKHSLYPQTKEEGRLKSNDNSSRKSSEQNDHQQKMPYSMKGTKEGGNKQPSDKDFKADSNEKENIPTRANNQNDKVVSESNDTMQSTIYAGTKQESSDINSEGMNVTSPSKHGTSNEYEDKGAKPKAKKQNDLYSPEKYSNETSISPLGKDTARRKSAELRKGATSTATNKQYTTAEYTCLGVEDDIEEIREDGEDEDADVKIVVTEAADQSQKKRPCPKCVAADLLHDRDRDRKRFYSRSEGCSPTGIYGDGRRRESERSEKTISYARKFESDSKIRSDSKSSTISLGQKSSTLSLGLDKDSLGNATDDSTGSTVNELLLKQEMHRKRKIKPFKELAKFKRGIFRVGIEGDRKTSMAKTIVIMPDKKLIIFDRNNKCIKLFDPEFNPLDRIIVPSKFCGLAAISESKFIASLPQTKKLHTYRIDQNSNKIKLEAVHVMEGEFYSLAHYKHKLYLIQRLKNLDRFAEDDWKIVKLDLKKDAVELEELRAISPGHQDFTLCVNDVGVYMTNKLEGEVLLLWHDGTYKQKYKVQLSLPIGITTDGMGNVYVSGGSVTSFIEICKPDLHGSKIIYNKTATDPVALEFDKHDNLLYVCDRIHGTVMKYKIEHRGMLQGLMSSFVRGEGI